MPKKYTADQEHLMFDIGCDIEKSNDVMESWLNLYMLQNMKFYMGHGHHRLAAAIAKGMRIVEPDIMKIAIENYDVFEAYTIAGNRPVYKNNGFYVTVDAITKGISDSRYVYIPLTYIGRSGQPTSCCENVCNFDLSYDGSAMADAKESFIALVSDLRTMVNMQRAHV